MRMVGDEFEHEIQQYAEALRSAGFYVSVDDCVDSLGAAELLGIDEKTLRNQRWRGIAPPESHRIGRRYFYRIADLLQRRTRIQKL